MTSFSPARSRPSIRSSSGERAGRQGVEEPDQDGPVLFALAKKRTPGSSEDLIEENERQDEVEPPQPPPHPAVAAAAAKEEARPSQELELFKNGLLERYGSFFAAWRLCLDVFGDGKLGYQQFCDAVRRSGVDYLPTLRHFIYSPPPPGYDGKQKNTLHFSTPLSTLCA